MPTARESLLNAALAALAELPWSAVRMVDIASAAGVSRQTLYNEFGSKEGLARALVRREADAYLRGLDRVLGEGTRPAERLASVAEWTVGEARTRPLLRALLTGCWGERMPAPKPARPDAAMSGVPAQRRADAAPPAPAELVVAVRDRLLVALDRGSPDRGNRDGRTKEDIADLTHRCELAARIALSYVVAPVGAEVGALVRKAVGGVGNGYPGESHGGSHAGGISATSRTAADR